MEPDGERRQPVGSPAHGDGLSVGSLFSGIGGLDHGLARAGLRHAFFCESDPWRRTVLAHWWPGVPIYEDVADVAADRTATSTEHLQQLGSGDGSNDVVALLCGGFPCQDVSVAGRRAGLAGARSGLFHEYARVAETLRPRWLLVENVPGLLSSNGGRDFGVVVGTLADLGYGVAWRILDSRFFGVPQRRRRVFIVGTIANSDPRAAAERAGQVLAVGTRCSGHPATRRETREDAAVASLSGLGTGGPDDNDGQGGRLVSLALNAGRGKRDDGESETFVAAQTFDWQMGGSWTEGTQSRSWMHDTPGRTRSLSTTKTLALYQPENAVRRLTPTECERLQALPDGWTAHGPDSRRYAALGDAVTATVAEWIGQRLIGANPC